jgi:hypothetical protein
MRVLAAVGLVMACSSPPTVAVATVPPATQPAPPPPQPVAAVWTSCLLAGTSPCISTAPVNVQRGVLAWSDWIARHGATHAQTYPLGMTECRWVEGLPDVLLCGSYDTAAMNPLLLRASLFVEGLQQFPPGTVARGTEPAYRWALRRVGGFDLMKRHFDPTRRDLVGFFTALDAACTRERALCATPSEQAMRELLERAWSGRAQFVVVTFAYHGPILDSFVVSHELLHAQYFTSAPFREVVDAYWTQLPAAERDAVTAELGQRYDKSDDLLIRNEFQAYVLMAGAENASLAEVAARHREPLRTLLRERGVTPIVTELRPTAAGRAAP